MPDHSNRANKGAFSTQEPLFHQPDERGIAHPTAPPGFAYGEGSASDVKAAFGYVPQGLQQLSGFFSAPFSGYNLQFPFFSDANAPLWHAAIGYEISGIIGVLVIGLISLGLGYLFRRREPSTPTLEQAEGPVQ